MRHIYETEGSKRTRERIEIVRLMSRAGMDAVKICARLDKFDFFPDDMPYQKQMEVVAGDIRKVKREDKGRFDALREDSQAAWAEYVGRQMALFEKCMDDGDHALATQVSKDIARAYGIDTNEPIKIEGDLVSLMRAATQKALEKRNANTFSLPPPQERMPNGSIREAISVPVKRVNTPEQTEHAESSQEPDQNPPSQE